MAQTSARSIESKGTNKLFKDDSTPDTQGDGGAVPQDGQAKFVGDENCPVEEAKLAEKVVDEDPVD